MLTKASVPCVISGNSATNLGEIVQSDLDLTLRSVFLENIFKSRFIINSRSISIQWVP